ncbi:hypothetical protein ACQPYK_14035 [Streptosporangium sp. CA-135522]|uniref:hypothetical protein n=1 Tax=Streptosporangium sp. CA-135522 TaxID=3240072 RepID=UPI003D8FCB37
MGRLRLPRRQLATFAGADFWALNDGIHGCTISDQRFAGTLESFDVLYSRPSNVLGHVKFSMVSQ